MKKQKLKKTLKRKKNEGMVAYFERWSERVADIPIPAPGCGPLIVSSSLYQKIKNLK